MYVSWTDRGQSAGGPTSDAWVSKLDPSTLATDWSNGIGTIGTGYDPVTDTFDLGSADRSRYVVVVGSSVYVTGTSDDPAISEQIDGLPGSGGFLRMLTDLGDTAQVEFTKSVPFGEGLGASGAALYLTGADSENFDACTSGTCYLAKIVNTSSGPVWPDFDGDGSGGSWGVPSGGRWLVCGWSGDGVLGVVG